MRTVLLVMALVLLLATPPVDPLLDAVMRRHVEVQLPALLLLGFLAGRGRTRPWLTAANPYGVTGLAYALAVMAFWMIPRSLDAAVVNDWVDQLLHFSMFSAGAALAWSLPLAPFVLRMALGLHGVAMLAALGMVYSALPTLICATYSLQQQQAVGRDLLAAATPAWLALWLWAWLQARRWARPCGSAPLPATGGTERWRSGQE